MAQISVGTIRVVMVTILLALPLRHGVALLNADAPIIRTVDLGHGITLHYVEVGKGTPVILVHGSLSDGGYWADQIGPFADHYRVIAMIRPGAVDICPPVMVRYSVIYGVTR